MIFMEICGTCVCNLVSVWYVASQTTSYAAREGDPLSIVCTRTKSIPKPTFSWVIVHDYVDENPENIKLDERIQIDDEG